MIKKLQRRFIRIALVALTVAMVLVVGIVNAANWISVRGELAETIAFLSENEAVPRDDIGRATRRLRTQTQEEPASRADRRLLHLPVHLGCSGGAGGGRIRVV